MQIKISSVIMGHHTKANKNVPKFPKCIHVGTMFKKANPHGDKEYSMLIFYGSVNIRGKDVWSFEIEVNYFIDREAESEHETEQLEADNFMKQAFEKSNEVFKNYTAKSFLNFWLCPVDNFSISPSLL